jgi:hypothetical protein
VFPDVNGHDGVHSSTKVTGHILVGSLSVLKLSCAFVVNEPSPTGSLQSCSVSVEERLEVFNCSPLSFNHLAKVRIFIGKYTATFFNGSKRFPEEFVVQMTSAIKFDSVAKFNIFLWLTLLECFVCLSYQFVQIVYICSVMLSIVELHEMA